MPRPRRVGETTPEALQEHNGHAEPAIIDAPPIEDDQDEVSALISGLQGGVSYVATVYRENEDGEDARLGKLPVRADQDPDDLLERIQVRWGGGRYRLQLRAAGARGTVGNATALLGGDRRGPDAEAQAPAPRVDPVVEILRDQVARQQQMIDKVLERISQPPPAPAATAADEIFKQARTLLSFGKLFAREQATPAAPGWMTQLGEVLGPLASMLAPALHKAAAAVESGAVKRPAPPPPRRTVANETPHPMPSAPASAIAGNSEPSGAPDPGAAAGESIASPEDEEMAKQIEALLVAAAKHPNPDPAAYASSLLRIGGDRIRMMIGAMPVGTLAADASAQIPDLARNGFATRLEAELRKLCAAPAEPRPS